MCNRTAGLVAREIEARGIPTVTVSLQRRISEAIRPPRTLFLRWPFGHPFGEAESREQQLCVLLAALDLFADVKTPGGIVDAPWAWRRETYADPIRSP